MKLTVIARQQTKESPKQSRDLRLLRHRLGCILAMTVAM